MNKKIKWLIYTVLLGLIPMISRLMIYLLNSKNNIEAISSSDLIIFGLILHISNINEIEHLMDESSWKTMQNGISLAFISCLSALYAINIMSEPNPELLNKDKIKIFSFLMSAVSLILSYSVYNRINTFYKIKEGI